MNNQFHLYLRFLLATILLAALAGIQPFTARAQETVPTVDALARADTALSYGDYATAIEQYTAAGADPDVQCAALYGLGVTHLRAVQQEEADSTFTRYLEECEASFRVLIMRGQVRQQQGQADEALADYRRAMSLQPGVLDSYLYERMASLDLDRSVYYLRLAAEAQRAPERKFALRERLAEIYAMVGSSPSALAEYNVLLREIDEYRTTLRQVQGAEFDQSGELRARIERAAAEHEMQSGRTEAGYARLQRVITHYSETSSALPALISLVVANQPVDLLIRMRINVMNENYGPVVGVLAGYLNDPDTAEGAPAELYVLLGRAQRGLGNGEAALAAFEHVLRQHPENHVASVAALERGQTYAQIADADRAAGAFWTVATRYPQSPEAPEALLRAAEAKRDAGDIQGALRWYDQLGTRYPDSEQAQQGLFEAGMLARDDDPARAAEFFGRVGSGRGFMWQGKSLEQTGDTQAARQAWERATAAEPGTFFAIRGCELLHGLEPFAASQSLQIQPITAADRLAAEQWTALTFGVEGVSATLSPELASHPALERGTELWALGWWAEARAELDALHQLHRNDPVALLQLAFHYQSIGIHRSSLFAAVRLVFLSDPPLTGLPRAILQMAYPFYYADLFVDTAEEYDLDPLLVAALTRQESAFDATVTSVADARGLMQLIPSTAQDVANQLGLAEFTLHDLGRPVVNIPLGVYYLNAARAYQNGSVAGALLSYNAGPGTARAWVNEADGDIIRLHEIIAYEETRQYLALIYHNYTVYRHLYGDGVPACMFEGTSTVTE